MAQEVEGLAAKSLNPGAHMVKERVEPPSGFSLTSIHTQPGMYLSPHPHTHQINK